MKKRIFVWALAALTLTGTASTIAQAQQTQQATDKPGKHKTPEERAQAMTERMSKHLGLSADQQAKVQALNLEKALKMSAIQEKRVTERKKAHEEAKAYRQDWDNQLKTILTTDQYAELQKQQAERKAAHQDKKKGRKGDK
jgi:Spy/CpxP family protein refolding chaperone